MSAPKHYFATNGLLWATSEHLAVVIKRLETATREDSPTRYRNIECFWLMEVPLPEESTYDIKMFQPDVDGLKDLGEHRHTWAI